jgi:3-dehydroquinate dehydratase/shikimate dehydrogenase
MVALTIGSQMVKIASHHDFSGVPDNIDVIFDRLTATGAEIVKIAVSVTDAAAAIPVSKLIDRAKDTGKKMIPVAMGEAGKWTRILGLARGAFLTYASLETGNETASGQLTAEEMLETFRVRDLDENTSVYGTLAGDTSYSASPYFQNAAFIHKGINAVFVPLQTANIDEFMRRMVKPETREIELNFKGFAVTNPHKQSIIKHLDIVDETATKIGAVNTIKIEGGKFYGFNTDAIGFIVPLKKVFRDLQNARVAVIGAGGAARAVVHAMKQEKAEVTICARNSQKGDQLANEFNVRFQQLTTDHQSLTRDIDILVNSTPLGTKGPCENETIATAEQLSDIKLVYDLVYNPAETVLIREAKKAGVRTIGGLDMLITQGAVQFKIWTGEDAPIEEMRAAAIKRLYS